VTGRQFRTVILPLVILVVLLGVYLSVAVQIHFFLHLLLGGTVALLVATAIGLGTGWFPPWLPVITIGAVVNAIPDVLYLYFHVAHRPWMDIFTWHVETHFMPGFPVSWYLLFLLALAAYFAVQVPNANDAVRLGPFALAAAAVAAAVVWAHERIPAGVINPDHRGHLLGFVLPVVTTTVVLLIARGRARRPPVTGPQAVDAGS
jgi:heme/copper-type cytochrome/quinol oxidase subunit 4